MIDWCGKYQGEENRETVYYKKPNFQEVFSRNFNQRRYESLSTVDAHNHLESVHVITPFFLSLTAPVNLKN